MATTASAAPSAWDAHVHVFDAAAVVRPGHYRPGHHPLADIERLARAHGIGRLVLVQPSVYGTDHGVLLQALEAGGGLHRGIAVVDPAIADDALDRLDRAGVRGIRFNLVSPAGHAGDPGPELLRLAPRLRERGWHVQWYVPHARLPELVRWQAQTGLRFVLDHLGDLRPGLPADGPAWSAVRALAQAGSWVKLSGWYRLGAGDAPYAALDALLDRVAQTFGERCVWGSDWPHTGLSGGQRPGYGDVLAPLQRVLGEATARRTRAEQPDILYGA